MFDPYLIRYISEFLKLCDNCNKYDYYNYFLNTCGICKKTYCSSCCKNNLRLNYNDYETMSYYCIECNKLI